MSFSKRSRLRNELKLCPTRITLAAVCEMAQSMRLSVYYDQHSKFVRRAADALPNQEAEGVPDNRAEDVLESDPFALPW